MLQFVTKSASFTRPANTTQYAANDLVANHATAGNVVVPHADNAARFPGGNGAIKGVRLSKSDATPGTLADAQFRVHLFKAAPTVSAGDNGAFAVTNGGAKGYLGSVDVTMNQLLGDGAFGRTACSIGFDTAAPAHQIYFLIEALDTYTPASAETFTVAFEIERN